MTFKINAPLGSNKIQIEADTVKQLMMGSGFFAQIPAKCGNCGGTNLVLNGYKNKGYDFYGVKCQGCNHELKFGQKKEDNSLFLRDDAPWEPPYQAGQQQHDQRRQDAPQQHNQSQQAPQQQQQGGQQSPPDDDIPF